MFRGNVIELKHNRLLFQSGVGGEAMGQLKLLKGLQGTSSYTIITNKTK